MKDAKYIIAYVAPLAAFLGLYFRSWAAPGAIYIAFIIIPFIEIFAKGTSKNLSPEEEKDKLNAPFFDFLLYLNVPILYGLMFYYFHIINTFDLSILELIGCTLNVGLIVGSIGINVAHELGHRENKVEQFLSKFLLLSALYMHFFIEHNRGHHKHVATPEDPSSARFNENLYFFWIRSSVNGWINAWKLEKFRLEKSNLKNISLKNEMLVFQIIQMLYLLLIALIFSWKVVPFAILIAINGFLILETVNYIEHYGLQRKMLTTGKYETVQPWHSWNSNHDLGRIYLYELTRHSDHHYKANRKYQILRHFDEAPQLPLGYPGSMILSLIPPLWFKVMNPRIANLKNNKINKILIAGG